MNNLISIFLVFIGLSIFNAYAFETHIIDQDIKNKKLPNSKIFKPEPKKYLSANQRDVYLEQFFFDNIQSMDHFDKDLLYKKILHYPYLQVKKSYPFVTKLKYQKLRDVLLSLEIHKHISQKADKNKFAF
ncbi:MAG: hypothetical protein QF441_11480 [Bacteriovoracaceae bacterium]|jgi:hypothetical protein|nr:hypothetical protein [Bacteriovoracaceae bacterium]|tara:strand:- start:134 stop:523 length:390 start_codon:yes stop_codon:yes gene_type:complete